MASSFLMRQITKVLALDHLQCCILEFGARLFIAATSPCSTSTWHGKGFFASRLTNDWCGMVVLTEGVLASTKSRPAEQQRAMERRRCGGHQAKRAWACAGVGMGGPQALRGDVRAYTHNLRLLP
jgi:hypothetical protein